MFEILSVVPTLLSSMNVKRLFTFFLSTSPAAVGHEFVLNSGWLCLGYQVRHGAVRHFLVSLRCSSANERARFVA